MRPSPTLPADPRLARGVVAVLLATAASATAVALATPLFSSADEAVHFDHAYQVWRGTLPVFEDGAVVDPPFGFVAPWQWTAQHPPLYYALLAPVVGPVTGAAGYLLAGYGARALNVGIAVLLVAAVMWATAQVLPRRPRLVLATGVVAASSTWLMRTGAEIYNDNFAALWATALLGVTARVLRLGMTPGRTAALAAVGSAGMLSRAAVATVLAACLIAVVLSALPGGRRGRWTRLLRSAGWATGIGATVLAAALWFYVRNYRLTGRFTGGQPEWGQEVMGRTERSLAELVTDPAGWVRLGKLFGHGRAFDAELLTVATVVLPLLVGVVVLVRRRREHPPGRGDAGPLALVGATTALVVLQQLLYATEGGQLHARYLLPVAVPVFLVLAAGLAGLPRVGAAALAVWALVVQGQLGTWMVAAVTRVPEPGDAPTFPVAAVAVLLLGYVAVTFAVLSVRATPWVAPGPPRHVRAGRSALPSRSPERVLAT
ncbi:hypothetical protein V5H98_13850 [Georgenia sp. M64]|uniref:hypothetical protein n=1 Tax=Georgenia sp. M64 TaxID=3120520 RepID=UPI0030E19342